MSYKSNTASIVRISTTSEMYEIFSTSNMLSTFAVADYSDTEESIVYEFSPLELDFTFYDKKILQFITDVDYKIDLYLNGAHVNFSLSELEADFNTLDITDKVFSDFFEVQEKHLIFKIQNFYDYFNSFQFDTSEPGLTQQFFNFTIAESSVLKIQWYINDFLATEGVVSKGYGLSSAAAQFNINANNINASIEDGYLEFTANGLQLHNGGLWITADTQEGDETTIFSIDEDDEPDVSVYEPPVGATVNPSELGLYEYLIQYYEYSASSSETETPVELGLYELVDGIYVLTTDTSFVDGKTYYTQNAGYVLSDDTTLDPAKTYYNVHFTYHLQMTGNGSFTGHIEAESGSFKGHIEAESGSFKGHVEADSGTFNGTINAANGTIGGFIITSGALQSTLGTYSPYEGSQNINPQGLSLFEKTENYTAFNTGTINPDDTSPVELGLYEIASDGKYQLSQDETFQTGKTYYQLTVNYIPTSDIEYDTSKTYYVLNSSVSLNGANGSIYANEITLGTGATIEDYITLGGGYIYNPAVHDGLMIEAGNIRLYENGDLHLGDLSYNNLTGILSGNNWIIGPDSANFSNITVAGTIKSSVFESGTIQNVGGSMIFAYSSKFSFRYSSYNVEGKNPSQLSLYELNEETNEYILTQDTTPQPEKIYYNKTISLDANVPLAGNDIVLLSNGQPEPSEDTNKTNTRVLAVVIEHEETNTLQLRDPDNPTQEISNVDNYDTITIMNQNNQSENILIGVNAGNSRNFYLYPRGFSFIQATEAANGYYMNYDSTDNLRLFLGDLNSLEIEHVDGYGLYSDNVFLRGSLITSDFENIYAGMTTKDGPAFNLPALIGDKQVPFSDISPIVLWAGANGLDDTDIQKALFQVTQQGTIYAQRGYFADSVIVNSQIGASILQSPAIYGIGEAGEPSLKLTDVAVARGGISFRKVEDNVETEVFNLNESDLRYYNTPAIKFSNQNIIEFTGNILSISGYAKIGDLQIIDDTNGIYSINHYQTGSQELILNNIEFNPSYLFMGHAPQASGNFTGITIGNEVIDLEGSTVNVPNVMNLGEKASFVKVQEGFNIMIEE